VATTLSEEQLLAGASQQDTSIMLTVLAVAPSMCRAVHQDNTWS